MSKENVALARRFYPGPIDLAAATADPEATRAFVGAFEPLTEPHFETTVDPAAVPLGFGQSASGTEGFLRIFRDFVSAYESWTATANEFIDVDENRVLVICTFVGRLKGQQAGLKVEGGNLLTFRDGKLARIELFLDQRDALKAAGLSE